jgi:hypothetical protein
MNTDDSVWQKPKKKTRKTHVKKKKEKASEEKQLTEETPEEEIVIVEAVEEEIHYPAVSSGVENVNFGETNWEKETKYLKAFFTSPLKKNLNYYDMKMNEDKSYLETQKSASIGFLLVGFFCLIFPPIGLVVIMISGIGLYYYTNQLKILKVKHRKINLAQKKWHAMSPEPMFSRLSAIEKQVAESSYHNLGIIKNAKPSEGGVVRPPAYCYGPHFSFDDFVRIDQTGYGKGAGYAKYCNLRGKDGWYSRTYDMMVVHFTTNQLLVYKCIFDCLEMTKTMEESYEWNYRHVVGINIMGDEEEKNVGGGFSLTGTKYLTISAASGDKIKIVLGAGTKQLDKRDGETKTRRANIGGSERIFNVANSAMNNIRQAIREKAN